MSEGEKLHRLLEYISTTGQSSYEYDELIPAYKYGIFKRPNVKEIERLCKVLVNDDLVTDLEGRKSGGIVIKPQAIAAFYAGKYFQEEEDAGYSSSSILGAVVVGLLVVGGGLWLGYQVYDRGKKLQEAQQTIQRLELRDVEKQAKIGSLTISKDSLQNLVTTMSKEIEDLKKPIVKPSTRATRKKK